MLALFSWFCRRLQRSDVCALRFPAVGDIVAFYTLEEMDVDHRGELLADDDPNQFDVVANAAIITGVGTRNEQDGSKEAIPIVFLIVFPIDGKVRIEMAEYSPDPMPDCWGWRPADSANGTKPQATIPSREERQKQNNE